eukprot:scaffold84031_cov22-Tisochrysis_lutea.AAC.1
MKHGVHCDGEPCTCVHARAHTHTHTHTHTPLLQAGSVAEGGNGAGGEQDQPNKLVVVPLYKISDFAAVDNTEESVRSQVCMHASVRALKSCSHVAFVVLASFCAAVRGPPDIQLQAWARGVQCPEPAGAHQPDGAAEACVHLPLQALQ